MKRESDRMWVLARYRRLGISIFGMSLKGPRLVKQAVRQCDL